MPEGLAERAAALRWYHTIALPGGVVTRGEYDLRDTLRRLPFPPSLRGKRCLDVGTHDGFWAFEMERRGADEVVAIDLDDPARYDWPLPRPPLEGEAAQPRDAAFRLAHEALGSRVQRRVLSVYDLSREEVGGFDFVFIGTLLLHLRDPIGALAAIRRVCDGELLVNDVISLSMTLRRRGAPAAALSTIDDAPFWWVPNAAGLERYVRAAGFEVLARGRPYLARNGAGAVKLGWRARGAASLRRMLVLKLGVPHAWVVGRPLPDRA